MTGNATFRSSDTAILAVCAVDAPVVVTSPSSTTGSPRPTPGSACGPACSSARRHPERRWWSEGTTYADGAAMAGAKALAEAGVDTEQVGLMINTSVSRAHLEPSSAVAIHHALGLPSSCQNFDVANACLGFVNGIQLASAFIDAGTIDYALLVNGEEARDVQERTLAGSAPGHDGAGRDVRVRDPHARVRCRRHGPRPGR
jgi:3-oxoacyl-[acyl-carrier-protein] synthase-3